MPAHRNEKEKVFVSNIDQCYYFLHACMDAYFRLHVSQKNIYVYTAEIQSTNMHN